MRDEMKDKDKDEERARSENNEEVKVELGREIELRDGTNTTRVYSFYLIDDLNAVG